MDDALRRELGAHLRAAREQVRPEDVGLGGGGRRRTPGLRREEVAALAGVSVAWYTWLEQGRVSTTRQVLDAVCRVLAMDQAAHRHTLALAGFTPPTPLARDTTIGEPTRALLSSWADVPAAAVDTRFDIMATNAAYRGVWGDPADAPAERRNVLITFATRSAPSLDVGPVLRGLYQQFRANTAHAPDDPRAAAIVGLLLRERPELTHWWQCRSVGEFVPVTTGGHTFCLLRPVGEDGTYLLTQVSLLRRPAEPGVGHRGAGVRGAPSPPHAALAEDRRGEEAVSGIAICDGRSRQQG
ncbi:helix-turn-helix domain-containing protein [Nonomuraea sp. NPDC050783]|uniref:MmyB family transcriptional regulator n=1 Tax=Nonomuraea sp. NPDC050783 TaxID=3154634 RepID=UPI0034677D03